MKPAWRRSKEYRRWRVAVIRRDKTCVMCHCHERRQAHHLEDGSHNPELRFDVDNGVTLCWACHMALHTMYKKSYREKTTQDDFINFVDLWNYAELAQARRLVRKLENI